MGFPVGYSELFIPKTLLHLLYFAGLLKNAISFFFNLLRLSSFLDHYSAVPPPLSSEILSSRASAFKDLLPPPETADELPAAEKEEGCAVCLCEFFSGEEVGQPAGCRHVFHRRCLERWLELEQMTCPLCRGPIVLEEAQAALKRRLWDASAAASGGEMELQTAEMAVGEER